MANFVNYLDKVGLFMYFQLLKTLSKMKVFFPYNIEYVFIRQAFWYQLLHIKIKNLKIVKIHHGEIHNSHYNVTYKKIIRFFLENLMVLFFLISLIN